MVNVEDMEEIGMLFQHPDCHSILMFRNMRKQRSNRPDERSLIAILNSGEHLLDKGQVRYINLRVPGAYKIRRPYDK